LDERRPHSLTRDGIRIHDPADFADMRKAGQVVAGILDDLAPLVTPGATTAALNDWITARVDELGVTSATIGYRGY
jgi:methionyl aminopeptidase